MPSGNLPPLYSAMRFFHFRNSVIVCGSMRTSTRRRLASSRFISFISPTGCASPGLPGFDRHSHVAAFALQQSPMLWQLLVRDHSGWSHIESFAAQPSSGLGGNGLFASARKSLRETLHSTSTDWQRALPSNHVRNFAAGAILLREDDAASVFAAQPLYRPRHQLRVFRLR